MIIEHYGIKVKLPTPAFGCENDIQIRDYLYKLTRILKQKKVTQEKMKKDVTDVMKKLEHLCNK